MHRFFFATKDAFINSGSDQITGENWLDKNTGQDEILELKKVFWNRDFHYPTRLLIKFDSDEIENFISSSNIGSTSYSASLRLYETKGTSGLSETYKIAAYPVSESWNEGVGKESDRPKTTDGVSWKNRQLVQTPLLALNNLRTYIEQFRMINDSLDFGFELSDTIFTGYYINFGVNFEVNYDRRFNATDVKLETIDVIKDFFNISKMQFKQAINMSDLKYNILGLDGIVGIKTLSLFQNTTQLLNFPATATSRQMSSYNGDGTSDSAGESGYGFRYEMGNATVDDVVRPSATPAVFELRNPDKDIYGRVV